MTLYMNDIVHMTRVDSLGLAWTRLDSLGLAWTRLDSLGLAWTRFGFNNHYVL
jgi:hypothetical protein